MCLNPNQLSPQYLPPDGSISSEKLDYVFPLQASTEPILPSIGNINSLNKTVEPQLTFYGPLKNTLMDSSLKPKKELWTTLEEKETTEMQFSDTAETSARPKFGLSNLS